MKGKIIVLAIMLTFLAACTAPQLRQEATTFSNSTPCNNDNCGKRPS